MKKLCFVAQFTDIGEIVTWQQHFQIYLCFQHNCAEQHKKANRSYIILMNKQSYKSSHSRTCYRIMFENAGLCLALMPNELRKRDAFERGAVGLQLAVPVDVHASEIVALD